MKTLFIILLTIIAWTELRRERIVVSDHGGYVLVQVDREWIWE